MLKIDKDEERARNKLIEIEQESSLKEACKIVGCSVGFMFGVEVVKKLIDAGYRKDKTK